MTLRIVFGALNRDILRCFRSGTTYVAMTRKKLRVKETMAASLFTDSSATETALCSEENPNEESDATDEKTCSESSATDLSQPDEKTETGGLKFLVVGLGNPERDRTRHSVGMLFVDRLAKKMRLKWKREAFKKAGGLTASGTLPNNVEVHLLKPRIPMNLNGTSVIKAVRLFSVSPQNVYLAHDELDKSVGEFQLKEGGSASGHRGVKSVMNCLQTDVMPRLRIGIDRPEDSSEVVPYVLEEFPFKEYKIVQGVIDEAIQTMLQHMEKEHGVEVNIMAAKVIKEDVVEDKFSRYRGKDFQFSRGRQSQPWRNDYQDSRKWKSAKGRRPRFLDDEDDEWASAFENRRQYKSSRGGNFPTQRSRRDNVYNSYDDYESTVGQSFPRGKVEDHLYSDDEFEFSRRRPVSRGRGQRNDLYSDDEMEDRFPRKNRYSQGRNISRQMDQFEDFSDDEFDYRETSSDRNTRGSHHKQERKFIEEE